MSGHEAALLLAWFMVVLGVAWLLSPWVMLLCGVGLLVIEVWNA